MSMCHEEVGFLHKSALLCIAQVVSLPWHVTSCNFWGLDTDLAVPHMHSRNAHNVFTEVKCFDH